MRWITALLVAAFVACMMPGGFVAPSRVNAADPSAPADPGPAVTEPSPPAITADPEPSSSPAPPQTNENQTIAAPDGGSPSGGGIQAAPVDTSINFILTPNYVVIGLSNQFRAQINPAPLSGTVQLKIDGTVVASATVPSDGNDTHLFWSGSTPGPHIATAVFLGTPGYAASTSPDFPIDAYYQAPSVDVTASSDTAALDEVVDFTATVTPDPGTATITWFADGVAQTTVPLEAGGVSHWSTSFAVWGNHTVRARFDSNTYLQNNGSTQVHVPSIPTTVTVTVPDSPIPSGSITATVSISPVPASGTIRVFTNVTGSIYPTIESDGSMDVPIGTFAVGSYTVYASFEGDSRYGSSNDVASFSVLDGSSVTIATNRTTAVQGELPVILTATLAPTSSGTNNVTFLDDVGGVVQEFGPYIVDVNTWKVTYSSSTLRVGVHSIRARFEGVPGASLPATSSPVSVTVTADTSVHTTFTRSLSTFYPYKDSYKDTVALRGVLDEKATVTIRIYSSGGSLKRTYSLGWKGPGSFSASWNGRTAAGTAVAAGTYTVKASFKDVKGNARTIATSVTVSWRQVTWKTGATITRYGDQFAYYGTPATALYYSNDYSRGRILYSGEFNRRCDPCQTIYGISTMTLNTSGLAYRYVKASATGHSFVGYESSGYLELVQPGTTSLVFLTDLPLVTSEPHYAPISSGYISSHKVQLVAWCSEQSGDVFDLHYMKLTYQYAVWK